MEIQLSLAKLSIGIQLLRKRKLISNWFFLYVNYKEENFIVFSLSSIKKLIIIRAMNKTLYVSNFSKK